MSEHLTLLELDGLAEAPAAPAAGHLATCAHCQAELALTRAAQDRFRAKVFARTAPAIAAKLRRRTLAERFLWLSPLALVPALALALLTSRPRPPPEADLGVKGSATVRLLVQHAGQVAEVPDGTALVAGDALRFVVQPGGFPYLLVGSVDAAGEAGIIFPVDQGESGRIDPMAEFVLPGSAVLDASPGPERAFVLLSAQPISADAAKAAMRAVGEGGAAAVRSAARLPDVGAGAQLSVFWEKRTQ